MSHRTLPGTVAPPTRWALPMIAAAQLTVTLDGTTATIALPFIGSDLGITGGTLTWIVTGYTLVFGGFLLLGGRLGDVYGHRRTLVAGLLLFAVTAAARAVAPDAATLLVARTVQGLGAALVAPAALALVTSTFPAGPARTRAFAVYAAASGTGAGLGLLVGGVLTGAGGPAGGWRLTFLAVVPVALLVAVLAPRVLPESPRRPGRLDVAGALTAVPGLGGVVYGLTRAGLRGYGWSDPGTVAALVAGAALLAAFVAVESRSAHPMLPLRILADRVRAAAFTTTMCVLAGNFAMLYYLTQFLQRILGFTPWQTGLAFLPMSLGMVAGSMLSGRLSTRFDARYPAGIGTLVAAGSLLMLSTLTVDDGPAAAVLAVTGGTAPAPAAVYWTGVLPYLTALAIGGGMTFPGVAAAMMRTIPPADAGVAAGVLNTAQQIGGAIGLSVLSTVALHRSDARADIVRGPITTALPDAPGAAAEALFRATFTTGATAAFLVAALIMLAGSLVTWTLGRPAPAR